MSQRRNIVALVLGLMFVVLGGIVVFSSVGWISYNFGQSQFAVMHTDYIISELQTGLLFGLGVIGAGVLVLTIPLVSDLLPRRSIDN